jgi:hypothetical protein
MADANYEGLLMKLQLDKKHQESTTDLFRRSPTEALTLISTFWMSLQA